MNFKSAIARRVSLAVMVTTGLAMVPATANAGFFDQLFGGGMGAPAQPQIPNDGSFNQPDNLGLQPMAAPRRPRVKRVAAVEKSQVQKTTDLMSDRTLRPGDAVMMKSGVHVFVGDRRSRHDNSDFVALHGAEFLPKQAKGQLAAMDVAHRDPIDYSGSTTTMLEGRSVGGRPISDGYKITDARGRSIRYVGP